MSETDSTCKQVVLFMVGGSNVYALAKMKSQNTSLCLCENLDTLGSHSPTSTWKNRMAAGWRRNETKFMYCDMDTYYVFYIGLDEFFSSPLLSQQNL